ncbi:MAG: NAD(P)H-dependent oxidoreductase [Lautropia sp.]
MSGKPLLIVAHPDLKASRLNAALICGVRSRGIADVHDIYATYPDGRFDVRKEQALVDAHRRIVFQFPFYWYSCPPLLLTWLKDVWMRGWAYGPGGRKLNFKTFGVAVTTGSHGRDYQHQGRYRRTIEEVLIPFELLARQTGMHYLPPFSITAAREVSDEELDARVLDYCDHIVSSRPLFEFDGKDDNRAKTVYPAHYYTDVPEGEKNV